MENNSRKIAIFDFCETLVKFQSADAYINYVIDAEKIIRHRQSLIGCVLNKVCFRLFNVSWNKHVLMKTICGLSRTDLEKYACEFYHQQIRPGLIKNSVDYLRKLKEEGYHIIIASAGFDIYINYFASEMGVDQIICSELEFVGEKFSGRLTNYDLIGNKKVKALKEILQMPTLKDCDSIAVSDSRSDLPLLNYCKKAVVVCKKTPSWIKRDMEVLIWT